MYVNWISEIHDITDPEQWRHVPERINPADLPTRGMLACELSKSKLWLEDPDFLQAQEYTWPEKLPKTTPENDKLLEKRLENLTHLTDQANETTNFADRLDPTRFSSYSRLIHVTGWVWHFVSHCRTAKESRDGSNVLKCKELTYAENFWIRRAQVEAFPQGEKRESIAAVKSTNRQVWNPESKWSITMCWRFAVWRKAPNTYAKTSSDNQVTHQK